MNVLDLIILLIAFAAGARGLAVGFLRLAGALIGLFAGFFIGAAIAPTIAGFLQTTGVASTLIMLITVIVMASIFSGIGGRIGHALAGVVEYVPPLGVIDRLAGAVAGVAAALITIWLFAVSFSTALGPDLGLQIQESRVIQKLNQTLPPAPEFLNRLGGPGIEAIKRNFPRVFNGLEPQPAPLVGGLNAEAVNAAAAAGRAATVKIEGTGCGIGQVTEGSGFVAAPGLVATNAHVVAGISRPVVIDAAGMHRAQVVLFNPRLDFAVLRVSGLAARPLPVANNNVGRGTVGAVLGYPGGGDFTVSSAAVLRRQTAIGRDIYDHGVVERQIYELQAIVRPGNSGGPLVSSDGQVIGVVFAASATNSHVGYALTSAEVVDRIQEAAGRTAAVSTGACLQD